MYTYHTRNHVSFPLPFGCTLRTRDLTRTIHIEQFQNLDLNKTRILGYYGQGSKFFDREILDGIVAKPGGALVPTTRTVVGASASRISNAG